MDLLYPGLMKAFFRGKRPGRLLRWFFRAPLFLEKVGLGGWERILGIRFMRITTKGRRTGKPHRVLVDTLGYDEAGDVYYVTSAYGERADWVRNIRANPVFQVHIGGREFNAVAEKVAEPKSVEIMCRYLEEHRRYSRLMYRLLGVDLASLSEEELYGRLAEELILAVKPVNGMKSD